MTFKIYRKAFAGIALATSVLLTALVGGASAASGARVNELTGRDLLKSSVSVAPTTDLLNEGLSAAQYKVSPAQVSHGSSPAVRFSSVGVGPTASGPKHSEAAIATNKVNPTQPLTVVETMTPQQPVIAQEVMAQEVMVQEVITQEVTPQEVMVQEIIPQEVIAQETIPQEVIIAQANETELAQDIGDTFAPLSDDEIRQLLLIDPNAALDRPNATPSSGFLTPSAYGADWGDAFVGLSGASAGNSVDIDGSASFGFGVGDAVDLVGLEVSVGIISLDGVADDGIVGFKLHKVFPEANNLGVAVGWSNAVKWGLADRAEDTFYGVVTQRYELEPGEPNPLPLTVSLGVGTGTFRSRGAIAAGNNDPNVFGSVGLRVLPEMSVISSWTGSGLGMAVSAAPFEFPLVFTAGFSDVGNDTVQGPQFNGSMGYSFSFK